MSKVLKWVLYILLGLVALAVIAGIFFAIFNSGHNFMMVRPGIRMMQPYRFNYFSPGRMIFGGLFLVGLCLLVILGIVALVTFIVRGNRSTQPSPPAQAIQSTPPPASTPVPATTRTCSNCGRPVQDDWTTCPYCGNPLT